jgi:hypothetical protein
VEQRALHHIKKWRYLLGATAGLSGGEGVEADARRRYARAIRWWADFLADHRARWPQEDALDTPGAALAVDECGDGVEDDLLPMPHTAAPRNLGPIIQRYVLGCRAGRASPHHVPCHLGNPHICSLRACHCCCCCTPSV